MLSTRRDCIHALVKPAEVYMFSDAMDMAALRILPQTMSAPTIDFRFTTIVGYVENVIIEIGGKISIVERLVAVYHRFASIVLLDKPRELSRRIPELFFAPAVEPSVLHIHHRYQVLLIRVGLREKITELFSDTVFGCQDISGSFVYKE
jgi:hypothetical protein